MGGGGWPYSISSSLLLIPLPISFAIFSPSSCHCQPSNHPHFFQSYLLKTSILPCLSFTYYTLISHIVQTKSPIFFAYSKRYSAIQLLHLSPVFLNHTYFSEHILLLLCCFPRLWMSYFLYQPFLCSLGQLGKIIFIFWSPSQLRCSILSDEFLWFP